MSAKIPEGVKDTDLSQRVQEWGLERLWQGKVRDMYRIPGHSNLIAMLATDRISIFDFVLLGLVPDKGALLTAQTLFWLTHVLTPVQHHLVAFGRKIDHFLPAALRGDPEIQARTLIVEKHKYTAVPVECVVRFHLTGSALRAYEKGQPVCGHILPPGLRNGEKLERPIFTPTTKAASGHDEPLTCDQVAEEFGPDLESTSLIITGLIYRHAWQRSLVMADTKLELARLPDGTLVVIDEVGTSDSSRFWVYPEWLKALGEGTAFRNLDKEPTRDYGRTVETDFGVTGINSLDPGKPEHVAFVNSIEIPPEVLGATSDRYHEAFQLIAAMPLEQFQHEVMGIVR